MAEGAEAGAELGGSEEAEAVKVAKEDGGGGFAFLAVAAVAAGDGVGVGGGVVAAGDEATMSHKNKKGRGCVTQLRPLGA